MNHIFFIVKIRAIKTPARMAGKLYLTYCANRKPASCGAVTRFCPGPVALEIQHVRLKFGIGAPGLLGMSLADRLRTLNSPVTKLGQLEAVRLRHIFA